MIETALRLALMSARAFGWPWTAARSSPAVRARQSPAGAALVASGIDGDDEEVKGPHRSPGFDPTPSVAHERVGRIYKPLPREQKSASQWAVY